ncbi:PREDICTED: uncharacterized protein LOC109344689 [Lupinus angustifolius]|uniref:uncharacterized protein LOC109344689 n=1 Tax=Lupinus angustifolius TaxID=3871 RepID=UPI00092F4B6D|nr:PREDICTED: uncharacterized protein LOC109344689 [Lupinus angustifolius]
MNSNSVFLIPKFPRAYRIKDFRPIALANFQFKVITKVLDDRLASIAPNTISTQQRGFVKGRHIQDCICIASKAINLLDHKTFGENLVVKLDIRKAFDTIDWISTPTHVLYVDDILIFYKGIKREILALNKLILSYAQASSQHINLSKCKFYIAQATTTKLSSLSTWLGFSVGSLPFSYLGVPIFRGKPMAIHLQPIADRLVNKLTKWKSAFLSIMARVELARSIIHSMLTFSFHVYSWPISLLKSIDKSIRNFIWSGDINTKKLVIVAWHKLCTPTKEGGLGLRSIADMNQVALLKLAWEMKSSSQEWASFYRIRFYEARSIQASFVKSSIWPSIKRFWN